MGLGFLTKSARKTGASCGLGNRRADFLYAKAPRRDGRSCFPGSCLCHDLFTTVVKRPKHLGSAARRVLIIGLMRRARAVNRDVAMDRAENPLSMARESR